ncbi:MAG: hypothetical protein RMN25_05740 [Anaerolineae bacterium]|nr:hypothetical protein [Thermoflexales bacterium]MDW8407267.1 hypothetical protein [Anaerolineae bacterium]
MAETQKWARTNRQWLALLMVAAGACVALAGCDGGRPRANAPTPPVIEQPTPCPDSIACRALKRFDQGRQHFEGDR